VFVIPLGGVFCSGLGRLITVWGQIEGSSGGVGSCRKRLAGWRARGLSGQQPAARWSGLGAIANVAKVAPSGGFGLADAGVTMFRGLLTKLVKVSHESSFLTE